MNPVVVEVGPQTIRGGNVAPQEWISAALECIDDPLALLDERPVEVRRLWCDLIDAVAGEEAEALVLVVPTWWSSGRVELVSAAARDVVTDVVVLQRAAVLAADGGTTVVEFCEEFLVIAPPGAGIEVLPRGEADLTAHLGAVSSVLLDVPAGVAGPPPALAARLRAAAVAVTHSDHRTVVHAATAQWQHGRLGPARARHRGAAVLAGAVLSAAALGGGWAAQGLADPDRGDPATAVLVEGRVEVVVPAGWVRQRITSGPGSARVRVSAPDDDRTALHITQSMGPVPAATADVAESLWRAFESEDPGVFTDFDPEGSAGGRPAVTYREIRRGTETGWAVVIDGDVRIAIGCQSAPARRAAIDDVCARAVRSAHVVR